MGNCLGRQRRPQRIDTWTRTGIVSVRDEGLHLVPPDVVRAATFAKVVDLSHNRIVVLPDPLVSHMPAAQRLVLSSNAIGVVPPGLARCGHLKHLMLDNNALTQLPEDVCQLALLEVLAVHSNALAGLPEGLGALTKLKVLSCGSNKLQALPDSLGACASLEELDAHSNALPRVPAALAQLTKLRLLQLDNNSIRVLPQQLLVGCESLQLVSLHQNPITVELLESMPGFEAYEARRRAKYDKAITGNVMLSSRGMDEGVDRSMASSKHGG